MRPSLLYVVVDKGQTKQVICKSNQLNGIHVREGGVVLLFWESDRD